MRENGEEQFKDAVYIASRTGRNIERREREKDRSHVGPQVMWKNEDFMCNLI